MATKQTKRRAARPRKSVTSGVSRRMAGFVAALVIAGAASIAGNFFQESPQPSTRRNAPAATRQGTAQTGGEEAGFRVTEVPDGDTIMVRASSGKKTRVRLYGVDAPELHQRAGKAAAKFAQGLLKSETVSLRVMDTDQYGRTVAVVILRDGRALNEEMVREGHAWVYRAHCHDEPMCSSWYGLERHAKKQGVGLWRDANPTPPWKWRQQNPRQ
ncbi:MAG: hypothetical protein DELT_01971 [Desulfovibrio sp.]